MVVFTIFQSTLPREERPLGKFWMDNQRYFNPRSHERSDVNCAYLSQSYGISIHAPTRGATCIFYLIRVIFILFQSTLPREERLCITTSPPRVTLFQSTLPREERQLTDCTFFCASKISIHAPTRGATLIPVCR